MQINIPVHNHNRSDGIYEFDARGIAKRFRHAAIFGALDSLVPGERMRFVNDHNPIPLLQQMQARYGERVEINYLDSLVPGERMRFVNDHNPIPLLQQMQARYGERVEINYLDQGPQGVLIDFVVKAA